MRLMSRIQGCVLLLAVAAVAVVGSSAVAYADPPDGRGKPATRGQTPPTPGPSPHADAKKSSPQRHGLAGEISGLPSPVPSTGSFTLTPRKGGPVTVHYAATTQCHSPKAPSGSPGKPSSHCSALRNGDFVAVSGAWSGDTFTAKRINVAPGRSLHGHCAGTVAAASAASLTVNCAVKNGPTVSRTFVVNSSTKLHPKGVALTGSGARVIRTGDRVTVVYTRDPSTNTLTAKGVVLHHEGS